jgi:hypothetical protein
MDITVIVPGGRGRHGLVVAVVAPGVTYTATPRYGTPRTVEVGIL